MSKQGLGEAFARWEAAEREKVMQCVGFQIACTLVQELFPNTSLPVSDVVQDLQLFEFPREKLLHKRLCDMVEHFRHDHPQ